VPDSVGDHSLAGDVANARLAAFAARHGFAAGGTHHLLSLPAAGIDRLPAVGAAAISPEHREAFLELHTELFPDTYYSGSQLLEQAGSEQAIVLGFVSDRELVGYAAGRIDEGGDGYIDFVGVAPTRRREGHGRTLVAGLSRALRERQPISRVGLTVGDENAAALALYDALGFERASSGVGYRRRA
jgi:ribosomal protein S18 acetylase RimI-like enzyme